jgi:hypothetical protein
VENEIRECYTKAAQWRKNLMLIPSGAAGDSFIREISRLFYEFAEKGDQERFALMAVPLCCMLCLQRPSPKSNASENSRRLLRCLAAWREGRIKDLFKLGERIQKDLPDGDRQLEPKRVAAVFNRLMMQGKVSAALRFLSSQNSGGVLSLDDRIPGATGDKSVLDILREKHPEGQAFPNSPGILRGHAELPSEEELRSFYESRLTGKTVGA